MNIVRNDIPVAGAARRYTQLPRFFRWFSDHCVLRQLDGADIARITRAMAHPDFARCWSGNAPCTDDDVVAFVEAAQAEWLRGTRYVMAVMRKQSHDFVGWVELRAIERGAWMLRWFIQPDLLKREVANDVLAAAADLMFTALEAQKLYANCPPGHLLFEHLLNNANFIELVPAGSLDHGTGKPRHQSLYELGLHDWKILTSSPHRRVDAVHAAAAWTLASPHREFTLV